MCSDVMTITITMTACANTIDPIATTGAGALKNLNERSRSGVLLVAGRLRVAPARPARERCRAGPVAERRRSPATSTPSNARLTRYGQMRSLKFISSQPRSERHRKQRPDQCAGGTADHDVGNRSAAFVAAGALPRRRSVKGPQAALAGPINARPHRKPGNVR